jgi:hypothetical protein
MKSIRIKGSVVFEMDEVMDVEDGLKFLRELTKDYVYDVPVKIDSICLEGDDEELDTEE